MKRSTWKKRALASMLALAMTAGMLPMASAASQVATPKAGDESGLEMNKTATLEDDGTYTINLEAYATGEVIQTVKATPTDIVLLLDVSGSMDQGQLATKVEYIQTPKTLGGAVISGLFNPIYHHCQDGSYTRVRVNTNLVTSYSFKCPHCEVTKSETGWAWDSVPSEWNLYDRTVLETKSYMEALKDSAKSFIDAVAEKNTELTDPSKGHRISVVKFAGTERTQQGNDFDNDGYNYTQIVEPMQLVNEGAQQRLKNAVSELRAGGATSVDYGMNRTDVAFQNAGSGTERDKVVVLFSDGAPTHNDGFEEDVANAAILKAAELKKDQVKMYSVAIVDGADPEDTTEPINQFFHAMSSNYPNASSLSNLGNRAPDSDYYKTAADANELNDIFDKIVDDSTVTKVTLDGDAVLKDIVADEFTVPESAKVTAETVECTGKDGDGNYTWAETGTSLGQENITQSGNSISVTGFNYKKQCVVENKDGTYSGSKVVVTIKGVEAKDAAATGTKIDTNAPGSGIYENNTAKNPVAEFVSPKTLVNKELYVLDYAKPAKLEGKTNLQPARTHLDTDGMNRFNKESPVSNLKEDYGTANLAEKALTYTPTTMDWKGYDTFYSFGKDANDQNIWSKVSVMPANNVYYEDDFMTTSGTGIVYGGHWEIDGKANNNTETPDNDIHGGWVEDDTGLSNDTGFSDGTAHKGNEKGATATFTFTGTGVDVYTHTTSATLNVLARIQGNGVDKVLVMNNQSVSGDYYQIPTLSFMGLDYGTYTVTITTTGTGLYYLDGIRVYNPIQGNGDVDEAYGDEAGAMFQSVRDILLESGDLTAGGQADGAVFLDTDKDNAVIADYESYGPKNEVYLAKGQSIAFRVSGDTSETVYIGLKSPTGVETTASVTNGTEETANCKVNHTTDLYYKVTTGENGLVVIENEGTALLSVTKLRTTGNTRVSTLDIPTLMNYMSIMDTLPEAPYGEVSNGSEGEGNVDIENPDQGQETPSQGNSFLDIVKDIFESIWNLF